MSTVFNIEGQGNNITPTRVCTFRLHYNTANGSVVHQMKDSGSDSPDAWWNIITIHIDGRVYKHMGLDDTIIKGDHI